MTEAAPDLTPPTKANKAPKAPKAPKEAKVAKEPKAPKEKKVRAAGSYGLHPQSVISLTEKENTYRGQRQEWFNRIKELNGKTVAEFEEACKGIANGRGVVQAPNGWLRFYCLDGTVKLTPPAGVPVKEAKAVAAPEAAAA